MTDYDNRKENQAFEHIEMLQRQRESAKRPESDKNQLAEQAKRERELKAEDDLFNRELERLGFGAMVVGGE